jgi:5-(carboxyamino)imidazole ribonucleotide synthase
MKTTPVTLGILGGGQLARMLVLEAHDMGMITKVYSPDPQGCARQVCGEYIQGSWDNQQQILKFVSSCDVVTFEFENIPSTTLEMLSLTATVYPQPSVMKICQDRQMEKSLCQLLGIPTASWQTITSLEQLQAFAAMCNHRCVLKTATQGYDGHGQVVITNEEQIPAAYNKLQGVTLVCEQLVDFAYETSVILVRNTLGDVRIFEPGVNHHQNNILYQTIVDGSIPQQVVSHATTYAMKLAHALDVVGLLAVEMFVLNNQEILVNELAPRPHNSGHWTMDACNYSQFNMHARAISGNVLPVLERSHTVVMQNLLGESARNQFQQALGMQNVKPHWYGKTQGVSGRKMAHVNQLFALNKPLYAQTGPVNLGI